MDRVRTYCIFFTSLFITFVIWVMISRETLLKVSGFALFSESILGKKNHPTLSGYMRTEKQLEVVLVKPRGEVQEP